MTAISNILASPISSGRLRPFDIRRDLAPVAELIEQCFAETLDPDGQRYLNQMRAAARSPSYLRWVSMAAERSSLPLSGYVWEDGDQIVGNLTLIPYFLARGRYYLIANVAVNPAFRRRGIARSLTARAIDHARQRGALAAWLHVREDNLGAVALYKSLAFAERAHRTTWLCDSQDQLDPTLAPGVLIRDTVPAGIGMGRRHPKDWPDQKSWLNQLYPAELNWHLSLRLNALRPDVLGLLYRMWNDIYLQQWSAWSGEKLYGTLAYQSMPGYADNLWLATRPEYEESVVSPLLVHVRRRVSPRRPLVLDYPAGRAAQSIQAAGFHIQQTLIWMSLTFQNKP